MEFVADAPSSPLLNQEEFLTLDAKAKLEYVASRLPPFEKRILCRMIESDLEHSADPDGQDNNIFTSVSDCSTSEGFDTTKFQYKVAKIVVEKATNLSYAIWSELFAPLSTEQAKLLVKTGVAKMKESDPSLDASKTSLTYGDIDFFSFANILERCHPQSNQSFADLGHGTGKGLICANLLYGGVLRRCYGVEIIPELFDSSKAVLKKFQEKVISSKSDVEDMFVEHRKCEMIVELGDMFEESAVEKWSNSDIVFVNSTCFEDSLMQRLAEVAGNRMKAGSRFISLTKQLPSQKFKLLDRRQYVMSWGEATCFTMLRLHE